MFQPAKEARDGAAWNAHARSTPVDRERDTKDGNYGAAGHNPGGNIPALLGREYPHGTRARYNASRCRCFACRRANSAYEARRQSDPMIPADEVRAHLLALSSGNVGRRAVAAACDLSANVIARITSGKRSKVRRSIAEKILAVDAGAIADHALVPAKETRRMLREIIRLGFTRTAIAARLGSAAKAPALQYKAAFVLAKTELRVRRLHAELTAGEDDVRELAPLPELPRNRITRALRFFDRISAQDLFDAMDVPEEERGAYTKALGRLVADGEVCRSERPFEYWLQAGA